MGTAPPQAASSSPPIGGNDAIQASDTPTKSFAWRKTPITGDMEPAGGTGGHQKEWKGLAAGPAVGGGAGVGSGQGLFRGR